MITNQTNFKQESSITPKKVEEGGGSGSGSGGAVSDLSLLEIQTSAKSGTSTIP